MVVFCWIFFLTTLIQDLFFSFFTGTFGQTEPWEIFTPSSWKHPMVPHEILIDPQSMPIHPTLEGGPSDLQNTDQAKTAPEELTAKVCMLQLQTYY